MDCRKKSDITSTNVDIVVMDMNPTFKAAVQRELNQPLIITEKYLYCPCIYLGMDSIPRCTQKMQSLWLKEIQKLHNVFYKRESKVNDLVSK